MLVFFVHYVEELSNHGALNYVLGIARKTSIRMGVLRLFCNDQTWNAKVIWFWVTFEIEKSIKRQVFKEVGFQTIEGKIFTIN